MGASEAPRDHALVLANARALCLELAGVVIEHTMRVAHLGQAVLQAQRVSAMCAMTHFIRVP